MIYAFHSPTPFNLDDAANEAVREITTLLASFEISSMLDSAYSCDVNALVTETQGDERSLLVFCYTAYEIVATLWNRPSRGLAGSLDHKVRKSFLSLHRTSPARTIWDWPEWSDKV